MRAMGRIQGKGDNEKTYSVRAPPCLMRAPLVAVLRPTRIVASAPYPGGQSRTTEAWLPETTEGLTLRMSKDDQLGSRE